MGSVQNDDNDEIGNINITPMVDIILVLLVIFMVTANFLKKESVNINLPKVAASDPNVAESVQVAITRDGRVLLEGLEINNEKLLNSLEKKSKLRPNMRVTLSADDKLPYGLIANVMGLIRKAGVTKIALSVKR